MLAAVQAFLLKHLLFISKAGLQPSLEERTVALMAGLTDILVSVAGEPVSHKDEPRYRIRLVIPNMDPPSGPIIPA